MEISGADVTPKRSIPVGLACIISRPVFHLHLWLALIVSEKLIIPSSGNL